MSIWYVFGVIAGILAAMAIVALVCVISKKLTGSRPRFGRGKYDERQLLGRGKAYQAGFFTVLIYELLYGVVDLLGVKWCVNITGIVIGLFLGITVFAVVAIVNDAYMSINEKPNSWLGLWSAVILLNLACTAMQLSEGELIRDGMLTEMWTNALCAAMFLVILVTQLVHNRKLKREAMEEE